MGTKILHTADIHLREFEDERWETLVKLLELGEAENIGIFVISGDLFNKDTDAESLRTKIREIFSANSFRIIIIPGNHDKDSFEGGKYFGKDVHVIRDVSTPVDDYDDVRIFGIPFEPLKKEDIIKIIFSLRGSLKSDKKNVLLHHGELLDQFFHRGGFGDEGDERYMPVKLSYFRASNIDYVLAGHFHSGFDCWEIEGGSNKYFVYPGSPISITKRETGIRKVNIFEVGSRPTEVPIDTPHFEDIEAILDPLKKEDPGKLIEKKLAEAHPLAKIILTVSGFINSADVGLDENELVNQINKAFSRRCEEIRYEFNDIKPILEDDLWQVFVAKLGETDHSEEKKEQLHEIAIRAMMGAKS